MEGEKYLKGLISSCRDYIWFSTRPLLGPRGYLQAALQVSQIGLIWVQIGQICQIGEFTGQIEQTPTDQPTKSLVCSIGNSSDRSDMSDIRLFWSDMSDISMIFVYYLSISPPMTRAANVVGIPKIGRFTDFFLFFLKMG